MTLFWKARLSHEEIINAGLWKGRLKVRVYLLFSYCASSTVTCAGHDFVVWIIPNT